MKKCCGTCIYSLKDRQGDFICGNEECENYGVHDGGHDEGCEDWEARE
ncbi:hypothetical protein [Parasporobacterium paucivorans]|uniref:Uncharacterized protein n=1 Tax=Parasporobacterium paucivorans DSM 15970 TaxID=1122934 RepID=A0A1M6B484_9FIRM|nr:hypothetical protein [Parasporobacterium paucivorans]SHI43549.1 hypothetical protein SAMN02745691_00256 [Parasporobacterium paucivorans DSM 15970]